MGVMILGRILGVALLFLLLVTACGKPEVLTGSIAADTASLLTIKALDELGSPLGGAEVYVNGELQGTTSKYGNNKGQQTVLLSGKNNLLVIKSDGFVDSSPLYVDASLDGEKQITITLEKERAELNLRVKDDLGISVEEATIFLTPEGQSSASEAAYTDKFGEALFTKINEGNYLVSAVKSGYVSATVELTVSLDDITDHTLSLTRLPHLELEVVDDSGQELPHVEVSLYTKKEYNTPGAYPLHIRYTDSNGIVSFDDVELEETYILILKKTGFSAQTVEKKVTAESQFLHLALEEEVSGE